MREYDVDIRPWDTLPRNNPSDSTLTGILEKVNAKYFENTGLFIF